MSTTNFLPEIIHLVSGDLCVLPKSQTNCASARVRMCARTSEAFVCVCVCTTTEVGLVKVVVSHGG